LCEIKFFVYSFLCTFVRCHRVFPGRDSETATLTCISCDLFVRRRHGVQFGSKRLRGHSPASPGDAVIEAELSFRCSHSSIELPSASGGTRAGLRIVSDDSGTMLTGRLTPLRVFIPTIPPCVCAHGIHTVSPGPSGLRCFHMCTEYGFPWDALAEPVALTRETLLLTETDHRMVQMYSRPCSNQMCNINLQYDGLDDGIFVLNTLLRPYCNHGLFRSTAIAYSSVALTCPAFDLLSIIKAFLFLPILSLCLSYSLPTQTAQESSW